MIARMGLVAWGLVACAVPDEAIVALPSPHESPSVPAARPNFVVVIIDDVGIDKVASYRVHPETAPTPTLDRLADEGLRFQHAFAMPTCTATRAALLTGRHVFRNHTGAVIWPFDTVDELPLDEVTLPELLATAEVPYDSALAGKWHLSSNASPSTTHLPTLQGFGWFSGSMNNLWVDSENESGGYGFFEFEKVQPDGSVAIEQQYATTDTTDDALDQLNALEEPFLLVVSYNGAHNPWHTPPQDLHSYGTGLNIVEKHLAATEAVDRELGRLVDGMSNRLRDHTYVVVVGDNGTPRQVTTAPSDPNRAKGTVAEGGVRVPMVVTGPGVPQGEVSDALISVVDLWPTLADLAGLPEDERSAAGPIDGVSQVAVWHGDADYLRDTVYLESVSHTGPGPWEQHYRALRDDRFKVVKDVDGTTAFFEIDPRGLHDGPDLLLGGEESLSADAMQALGRLTAGLDQLR
ncbi:MAG: sulfatase-like hydrolase/transferase [Myxococcota bacterium]